MALCKPCSTPVECRAGNGPPECPPEPCLECGRVYGPHVDGCPTMLGPIGQCAGGFTGIAY